MAHGPARAGSQVPVYDAVFDRPLATATLIVPGLLQLDGDVLVWRLDDTARRHTERRPPADLIYKFKSLASGKPERIARFASEYGPLKLCEHGLPWTHNRGASPVESVDIAGILPQVLTAKGLVAADAHHVATEVSAILAPYMRSITGCRTGGRYNDQGVEPVAAWRRFAADAEALLNIASRVHSDLAGHKADWRTIYAKAPWWDQSAEFDGWKMMQVVNEWLRMADVKLVAGWRKGRPTLHVGEHGLFPVLAVQLFQAVARANSLAACHACGALYLPTRRPRADQRRYCDDCRGARRPQRDAETEYRRRRPRLSQKLSQ